MFENSLRFVVFHGAITSFIIGTGKSIKHCGFYSNPNNTTTIAYDVITPHVVETIRQRLKGRECIFLNIFFTITKFKNFRLHIKMFELYARYALM